jgi:hypothetical protein
VRLSARGARQLTGEVEIIEDEDELAQVRRQARRVHLKASLVAALLTLAVLLLPQPA